MKYRLRCYLNGVKSHALARTDFANNQAPGTQVPTSNALTLAINTACNRLRKREQGDAATSSAELQELLPMPLTCSPRASTPRSPAIGSGIPRSGLR
jgi:hypothetical protein